MHLSSWAGFFVEDSHCPGVRRVALPGSEKLEGTELCTLKVYCCHWCSLGSWRLPTAQDGHLAAAFALDV